MLEAFTFDTERQGLSVQTFPIESNLKNINFDAGGPLSRNRPRERQDDEYADDGKEGEHNHNTS